MLLIRRSSIALAIIICVVAGSRPATAQKPPEPAQPAEGPSVPLLVPFTGLIADGSTAAGSQATTITLALYAAQHDVAAIWSEVQTVAVAPDGRFGVLLGAAEPLPFELFATGQARWIGITAPNGIEQPRALLTSVPYALKAADASTLGGRPASEYALAAPARGDSKVSAAAPPDGGGGAPSGAAVRGTGTPGALAVWTDPTTVGDSVVVETAGNIGIGAPSLGARLSVAGDTRVGGDVYANIYRDAAGNPIPNGDITRIAAGEGVAGGGVTGDVTLTLDTAFTDARYAGSTHGHTVDHVTGAARLTGDNLFNGDQTIVGGMVIRGNRGADVVSVFQALRNGGALAGAAPEGVGVQGLGLVGVIGSSVDGGNAGVQGITEGLSGYGVEGSAFNLSGSGAGVRGEAYSASAAGGLFQNWGGGEILIGQRGNVTQFRVDGAGNVYANAFRTLDGSSIPSGDVTGVAAGTGLTGGGTTGDVGLALDLALTDGRYAPAVHGHDVSQITNAARLAANTFTATQTIGAGNLDLGASTATSGNITKNGIRFLHNFGDNNTFLGVNAGNVTTGPGNTATGADALLSNTGGDLNTAFGLYALRGNTTGSSNTASGAIALWSNTIGRNNTASGAWALRGNTTGNDNTASGAFALERNVTGSSNSATGHRALFQSTGHNNVGVGVFAGSNATTGSNNIYLGSFVQGVAGEDNTMYLGRQGTQTKTVIAGIRGTTVTGGEAVLVDAAGRLGSGPVAPAADSVGSAQVIDDSLTASDLASSAVTTSKLAPDSVTADKVSFNYAASASEAGAAGDLACSGCVSASEVDFNFSTLGANTFAGTQTAPAFAGDGSGLTNLPPPNLSPLTLDATNGRVGINVAGPTSSLTIQNNETGGSPLQVRKGAAVALHVDASGRVHVGSTNAGLMALNVSGEMTASYVSTTNAIFGRAGSGSDVVMRPGTAAGAIVLQDNTGAQKAVLTNDGNFGIGLPNPTQKLDVAGNINASGSISATGFTGNGSALTNLPFPTGAATLGANTFSGSQSITGDVNASGTVRAQTAAFVTGAGTRAVEINGATAALVATSPHAGVVGEAGSGTGVLGTSSSGTGVHGKVTFSAGIGVLGEGLTPGSPTGVQGRVLNGTTGNAIRGIHENTGALGVGVYGSHAGGGWGVNGTSPDGIGVRGAATASSGIGVLGLHESNEGAAPGVFGQTNSRDGTAAIFVNTAATAATSFQGDIIAGNNGVSRVFRVTGSGRVLANGGLQPSGADFAESMAVTEPKQAYQPGDVMIIDAKLRRTVTRSAGAYSTTVAGIYSTKPGVLANPYDLDDPRMAGEIPLAIVGIVPCKVSAENGAIEPGDLLVTASIPGYAMKGTDRGRMLGAIVGKALEPLKHGTGIVLVLVTLQ